MEDSMIVQRFWERDESALSAVSEKHGKYCTAIARNISLNVVQATLTQKRGGVSDMRKYLLDLRAKGKTILIASHSAKDIDVLCDTVREMDRGRLEQIRPDIRSTE